MPTETELLAQKLRDVVEALIGADAALESRIVALENLTTAPMVSPAWHGIDPDVLSTLPPGAMVEFSPPKRKRWFSRAR